MPRYRAMYLAYDATINSHATFDAENDDEAISKARQIARAGGPEKWNVADFDPQAVELHHLMRNPHLAQGLVCEGGLVDIPGATAAMNAARDKG
jgi:hypothetical protein